MKILKPVQCTHATYRGRYIELWAAVGRLKKDEELPVECETDIEMRRIRQAAHSYKRLRMSASQSGSILYIRKKVFPTTARGQQEKVKG